MFVAVVSICSVQTSLLDAAMDVANLLSNVVGAVKDAVGKDSGSAEMEQVRTAAQVRSQPALHSHGVRVELVDTQLTHKRQLSDAHAIPRRYF